MSPRTRLGATMNLTPAEQLRLLVEDGLALADECGQAAADRALRVLIREALAPVVTPDIADGVMAELGEESLSVGGALFAEAGAPPALWPGVAAVIDAQVSDVGAELGAALREAAAEPAPAKRRWRVPMIALAAAAALLAIWPWTQPEPSQPVVEVVHVDFDLPGITKIESLESETASVVQVLQFDDDAPTIIFIDDTPMEEEEL